MGAAEGVQDFLWHLPEGGVWRCLNVDVPPSGGGVRGCADAPRGGHAVSEGAHSYVWRLQCRLRNPPVGGELLQRRNGTDHKASFALAAAWQFRRSSAVSRASAWPFPGLVAVQPCRTAHTRSPNTRVGGSDMIASIVVVGCCDLAMFDCPGTAGHSHELWVLSLRALKMSAQWAEHEPIDR